MGYIGNQQAEGFVQRPTKQDLTGATGTSLTLTHAVSKEEDIDLYINNVKQEPTTAYTVTDTAVTLTGDVVASDDIYVVYNSLALQTVVPPDGSVTNAKLASGAAASNLGTSVNLATIKDSTGTNTAMTIDSNGRVATPQRVRFHAYLNADKTTTSVGNNKFSASGFFGNNLDQIVYNVGNGYDSSTTTFTAPVDGLYSFTVKVMTNASGASQAYMGVELYINNVRYFSGWERADSAGYHKQQETFLVYCTANDTIEPALEIANNTTFSGGTSSAERYKTYFSGYLIG